MADVFVSYSRSDHSIVALLTRKLRDRGLEVWVDLDGLYAGEEFLPQILKEIEGAEAFLFFISPDSIASEYCQLEIQHASEHRKRILPVVHIDADQTKIPAPVASKQWLFARSANQLDQAADRILNAVQVDPVWVRSHTRLLERGGEWQRQNRDRSFLLRGEDLEAAEKWLASSRDKDPQPAPLHTEYILASRAAATRFRSIVLGAVTTGLVIALVLAGVALIQRAEKERQRRVAVSRQLAAQAQYNFESKPQLSLLLSAEALLRSVSAKPTTAEATLHQLLMRTGGVPISLADPSSVVDVSGNGRWVLALPQDRGAVLWRLVRQAGTESRITARRVWEDSSVQTAALAPDSRRIALVQADGFVSVMELMAAGGTGAAQRIDTVAGANDLFFARDGSLAIETEQDIFVLNDGSPMRRASLDAVEGHAFDASAGMIAGLEFFGRTLLWDLEGDPTAPTVLTGGPPEGRSIALSPDGRWLAGGGIDSVLLWDLAVRGSPRRLPVHEDRVARVEFSPDGRWLAAGVGIPGDALFDDRTVALWRIGSDGPTDRFELATHTEGVTDFAFTRDGGWLASTGRDHVLVLWNLSVPDPSRNPIALRAHEEPLGRVFPVDGGGVVTLAPDGLRLWNVGDPFVQPRTISADSFDLRTPRFSGDGRWLAVIASGAEGGVIVRDLGSGVAEAIILTGFTDVLLGLDICPEGGCLATSTRDGIVQVWRITNGRAVSETVSTLDLAIGALAISPDGKWLAVGGGALFDSAGTGVLELRRMQPDSVDAPVLQLRNLDQPVAAVAFSADGRWFGAALGDTDDFGDSRVLIWRMDSEPTAEPAHTVSLPAAAANLTFISSKPRVAVGGTDGSVYVIDPREPASEPIRFILHEEPFMTHGVIMTAAHAVSVSPDGAWLAAGSHAGQVRLWSLARPDDVPQVLDTGARGTRAVRFDPAGRWLAVTTADGGMYLWDVWGSAPEMVPLLGAGSGMSEIRFDADGARVAATGDGNLRLWDLRRDTLLRLACRTVGRNLTRAEWSRFFDTETYRPTCELSEDSASALPRS